MTFVYESPELEQLELMRRYQAWVAEPFRPYVRGVVMELGPGIGTMARQWVDVVRTLHLVEPARNLFPLLQRRLGHYPHVVLHNHTLEDAVAGGGIAAASLDAAIMINTLEHIEDDEAVLRLTMTLLTPGGYLLIFVPAMPWLYGSLDKSFGHFRRYGYSQLLALCRNTGCELIRASYFDVLGVVPWWIVNRLFRSTKINAAMARVYDAGVVPVARRLEALLPVPFGKNLVYIGRRPGAQA